MPYRSTGMQVLQVCVSRWFLCVRLSLSLEVWTVDVVVTCKAFQVAREAVRIRNSTTAVTVVLDSRCHSGATLVKWLRYQ